MHYLSFSQLQDKLGGRGRTTIYRDVHLGRLPKPMKIGSRLYWNEADIDATLQANAE
ncbi:helix-turn-helix transcriptional regulator [Roseobacter sp. GAI101]|uniref:helix-turn-helix transcriptional regulator n=1 Tax=Roseobacter sp. (strain GAI101) TaxID=391589 RepID=UPI000A0145BD|nr:AlpA family phage regulatory protein [Roseobacter sp. GAI101]